MVFEVDGADHPECRVPASAVVDDFNPVGNGLACSITGRPALPVIEFSRECLMVCVWVPNLHEEMDQNDYCGTTRSG